MVVPGPVSLPANERAQRRSTGPVPLWLSTSRDHRDPFGFSPSFGLGVCPWSTLALVDYCFSFLHALFPSFLHSFIPSLQSLSPSSFITHHTALQLPPIPRMSSASPASSNTVDQPVAYDCLPPLLPRSCPPPYEEAIVRPPNDTLTNPPSRLTAVAPSDFLTADDQDFQDFEEDEQEYEASRPLKMGKIPDARAQYTYIQPDISRSKAPACPHSPGTGSPGIAAQPYRSLHHQTGQALPSAPPMSSTPQRTYLPPPGPPPPLQGSEDNKPFYNPPDHAPPSAGSSSTAPPAPYQTAPVPFAGVPEVPGLINPQDISIADFKRTKKGIESYDKVLADPYQLYRFFVAHNERPTVHAVIKGKMTGIFIFCLC